MEVTSFKCKGRFLTTGESLHLVVFSASQVGIFGPKRDEVTGDWRKLLEELHNFYFSQNIIRMIKLRRMRWAGRIACIGEVRNVYKVLVGKQEEEKAFGRPRLLCIDNTNVNLREICLEGVDYSSCPGCVLLAGSCEHDNEHSGSIKDGEFLDQPSLLLAFEDGLCSMQLVH
jgi:hypothetical protein